MSNWDFSRTTSIKTLSWRDKAGGINYMRVRRHGRRDWRLQYSTGVDEIGNDLRNTFYFTSESEAMARWDKIVEQHAEDIGREMMLRMLGDDE